MRRKIESPVLYRARMVYEAALQYDQREDDESLHLVQYWTKNLIDQFGESNEAKQEILGKQKSVSKEVS